MTEPPDFWLRVVVSRIRETPWLAVPTGFVALAAAASVAARTTADPRAERMQFALWAWATVAALIAWFVARQQVRETPLQDGDDPDPIRVRWTFGGVATGFGERTTDAHAMPHALRLVGREWLIRDVVAMVAGIVPGAIAAGGAGFAAIPALALALGFPRTRRVALDVPWDDIRRAALFPDGRFLVWRRIGDRVSIELEAKFSQRDRLVAALRAHLGERFGAAREPDAAVAEDLDAPETGLAEEIVRRVRLRPLLGVAAVTWALALLAAVATLAGAPGGFGAAALLSVISFVFALAGGSQLKLDAWSRTPRAEGDTAYWFAVRWTNRRGWPGPRVAQAHLLPHGLRVVGAEWETWDSLVVLAWLLVSPFAGACFGVVSCFTLVRALGLPRRRRVAVDLCWSDVTRVEVGASRIDVRTRLAEPADRVVLDTQYAYRDGLVQAIEERLGERTVGHSPGARGTGGAAGEAPLRDRPA